FHCLRFQVKVLTSRVGDRITSTFHDLGKRIPDPQIQNRCRRGDKFLKELKSVFITLIRKISFVHAKPYIRWNYYSFLLPHLQKRQCLHSQASGSQDFLSGSDREE